MLTFPSYILISQQDKITFVDMEPCDAGEMRSPLSETPTGLVLEMTDVGRGDGLPTDLSQVGHVT